MRDLSPVLSPRLLRHEPSLPVLPSLASDPADGACGSFADLDPGELQILSWQLAYAIFAEGDC
jgi:hypothetical protein